MITSGDDDGTIQTLLSWLNQLDDREERRFLEAHPELLTQESECILSDLIEDSFQDKTQPLRDHLKLLRDARKRGGSVVAIREAYVNIHGGFNLDLPLWLEEVKAQYEGLMAAGQPEQSARECISLIRNALLLAQQDDILAPEMVASLYYKLATVWWGSRYSDPAQSIEAMIDAEKATLQIYTLSHYPYMYAMRQNDLGMAYRNRVEGDQSENIEQAIVYYRRALEVLTPDSCPEDHAMVQRNLGIAYQNRIAGERSDNLEQAIACHQMALRFYNLDFYPTEWAWIQYDLGINYYNRIEGNKETNQEQSITHLEALLKVITRQVFPQDWADTQFYLALAYQERISGEHVANLKRAIDYYKASLQFYTRKTSPETWAYIHYRLADIYRERLVGTEAESQEQEIACYKAALSFYTRKVDPERYATLQRNLAITYRWRIEGDKRENIERAISCYKKALRIFTRNAFPEQWASIQELLASAYADQIGGDTGASVEQAIACYEQALQIHTRDVFPEQWARTQRSLASAYEKRVEGERRANLEQAIACYENALLVYTRDAFPKQWASTHEFLAYAYEKRIEGKQSANQKKAIANYHKALQVYTVQAFPEDYARIQSFLGGFYRSRITGEARKNLEYAISGYEAVLQVYTREKYPGKWAETQSYLGATYEKRIAGKRRVNLECALAFYGAALQVFTLEAYPEEFAETQVNLGNIYAERIEGEQRENLERAITCYEEALRVYTRETTPVKWAQTLNRLGYTYTRRIEGASSANVEKGIVCYEAVLQIYTQEAFPVGYADVQNNLGNAYGDYFKGDRSANIEHQIQCYKEALQVLSLDSSPENWASTHNNLGGAYAERIAGEQRENLEQAIAHYKEALRFRGRESFPEEYAKTQNNLGIAYKRRIEGERGENLDQAVAHFKKALQILTLEAFPADQRKVQINLAEAEMLRGNWVGAHEAYVGARAAEDLLVAVGKGVAGRDAILEAGYGFAALDAFALTRLGRTEEAAVAIERGRTRGMAEALALNAADPKLISDGVLRTRYGIARKALIAALATINAPIPGVLSESEERRVALERFKAYNEVQNAFNNVVAEIRAAKDPADFLMGTFAAATILRAASTGGEDHALVYLLYTPFGGVAIAALAGLAGERGESRFAMLDLPELTYHLVSDLVEDRLGDESNPVIGGFVYAQEGSGYRLIKQNWPGETFRARAEGLHAFCTGHAVSSKLDESVQYLLTLPAVASIADQPLDQLTVGDTTSLEATVTYSHLQRELPDCLEVLAKTVMRQLVYWLLEQGVISLTLIPCGWLAAFPFAAAPMGDGRVVSDVLPMSVAPAAGPLLHNGHTQTGRTGVYALGNPHPTQQELVWGEAEALTIASLARRLQLHSEVKVQRRATRSWLVQALSRGYMVDASCHGSFNVYTPLDSALQLARGQRLLLRDLLSHKVNLQGLRLLLLSACQTAVLDTRGGAADEVHSLAAGMAQAGAQAVLATLWRVDDRATYLLMVRFAQEWLPRMEHEPPVVALARAQRWLRTVTNRELWKWQSQVLLPMTEKHQHQSESRSLERDSQSGMGRTEQEVANYSSRYDGGEAERIVSTVAKLQLDPHACPYADPIYWAGFQIMGW